MSSTMNSLRYVSIMFIYRKSTISVVVYMNQICPSLQRSHVVNSIRKQLNDKVEIVSLKDGAYRPLKPTLATILEHEVYVNLVAFSAFVLNWFYFTTD